MANQKTNRIKLILMDISVIFCKHKRKQSSIANLSRITLAVKLSKTKQRAKLSNALYD
jgi:hypothetical protein